MTNTLCGFPHSITAKVLEGKSYTFSADIWSLECIIYEFYKKTSFLKQFTGINEIKHSSQQNYPLPLETLDEISDIVNVCLKRSSDERMTIGKILDSEFLKDGRQKNTIKTIYNLLFGRETFKKILQSFLFLLNIK